MAFWHGLLLPCLLPLLATLLARGAFASEISTNQAQGMYPFNCSRQINKCTASLYHINTGLTKEQIAAFYSVKTSQITPISHANRQDYLVTVPCSCNNVNGTTAYFSKTKYEVKEGDTFFNISTQIYSGQVWQVGGDPVHLIAGETIPINLLCGCAPNDAHQIVVTYTVQERDTLFGIAGLLSSTVSGIQSMNPNVAQSPGLIEVGWVLYVPVAMGDVETPAPSPLGR